MQFRKTKQVSAGTMLLEQTLALTSQFDQPMDQDGHDAMDVGQPWPVPRHRLSMLACSVRAYRSLSALATSDAVLEWTWSGMYRMRCSYAMHTDSHAHVRAITTGVTGCREPNSGAGHDPTGQVPPVQRAARVREGGSVLSQPGRQTTKHSDRHLYHLRATR